MQKFIVNLNSINKIKEFSKDVSTFESDIDVVSGRYVIDAKSIMGLFSLDLSKPMPIVIHSDDDSELERFAEKMKNYEV